MKYAISNVRAISRSRFSPCKGFLLLCFSWFLLTCNVSANAQGSVSGSGAFPDDFAKTVKDKYEGEAKKYMGAAIGVSALSLLIRGLIVL